MIERMWRTVKYDDICVRGYETVNELYQGLSTFLRKYSSRKDQTLGMSPEQTCRGELKMEDAA